MGSKKKTTQNTNTTSRTTTTPRPTVYSDRAGRAANEVDYTTPILGTFGRLENQINNSGNDIFGADTSQYEKEKTKMARLFELGQAKGGALMQAKGAEQQARFGNNLALHNSLRTVDSNSSGQSRGTTVQSTPFSWTSLFAPGVQLATSF